MSVVFLTTSQVLHISNFPAANKEEGYTFLYSSHHSWWSARVVCVYLTHTHTVWLTAAREAHESDRQSCAGWDWAWQLTDSQENLYISPQPNNHWRDEKGRGVVTVTTAAMKSLPKRELKAIALHLQPSLYLSLRVCSERKMSVRETFESQHETPSKQLIFKQGNCRLLYYCFYVDCRLQEKKPAAISISTTK